MPVKPVKVKGGFMLKEPGGAISPHRKNPGPKATVEAQARVINAALHGYVPMRKP